MHTSEELKSILLAQPRPVCANLTPFELLHVDGEIGTVRVRFEPQPAFKNHFGHIQGGFATAMLDVVLSIAVYAKYRAWLPTAEIKTSFLEALPIGPCIGEARVIKAGRSLAFVEGSLLLNDGRPAVTATSTALVPHAP